MAGIVVIKIKDSVTSEPSKSVDAFRKERVFEGESYTISAREQKALPQHVADLWLAEDSDLEEISRT